MTQAAGTTTSLSTIGPAPAPEPTAPETSSAEPAAATPSPHAPPAKDDATSAPAPPEGGEPPPSAPDLHRDELSRRAERLAREEARSRKRDVDYQQRTATVEDREKKIAEREAAFEAFLADPIKWALDNGKDPVDMAKRFARPETEEQKRIRLLEERDRQREENAKKEREENETREAHARRHTTLRNFVSTITPEECPTLVTEYEAREIPGLIDVVLSRPAMPSTPEDHRAYDLFIEEYGQQPTALQLFRARYDRNPSDEEMRVALEQEALSRATSRKERGERYKPKPPPPQPSEESPAAATGPSSISNQHAAATSTPKPKLLSLEERRAAKRREIITELEGEGGES